MNDSMNSIQSCRNCLGTLQSLYAFIEGSPKRHAIFKNLQTNQSGTLKRVNGTRWSSRDKAVDSLINTYESVLSTLNYIKKNDKTQAGANAGPLLKAIKEFEFQFMTRVLYEIFERTGILVSSLQKADMEMDKCAKLLEITLESFRDHSRIF